MLFNSLAFLFAFLPAALILFHVSTRLFHRAGVRQGLLVALTLAFYAYGGLRYLPVLLVSLAFNYAVARAIDRRMEAGREAGAALAAGVIGNLLLLGYFKYAHFIAGGLGTGFAGGLPLAEIGLPLAISFYTFQQIGFLVDLSRRKVRLGSGIDYLSFVLFFPQLLSGPIVRWDELMPQLHARLARGTAAGHIVIGLAIFALGLFKKTVIADGIGPYAAPVFELSDGGGVPGMVDAWVAAFAYTAQIYFDFSGYSDMAIGVARMLGIVLPLNFHSPLRAGSVIEIWRRWHVTLSRWVQSYVFQPLSVPLARFAATRTRGGKTSMLVFSFAIPTMAAMVVVGVWHGAGWTFVLFGVFQGLYIAINEFWRQWRRKARKRRGGADPAWTAPLYRALTLTCFVVSVVMFRAADVPAALRMYRAMLGLGDGWIGAVPFDGGWPGGVAGAMAAILVSYGIVFLLPNTQQWLGRYGPVLEWEKWSKVAPPVVPLRFGLSLGQVLLVSAILFAGFVMMMRGTTDFIYFNF